MAPSNTKFLTDDSIRTLKTDAPQVIYWDGVDPAIPGTAAVYCAGLGIRVTSKGLRTFIMDYRTADGIQRRPKIGRWPAWSVDRARRRAIQWRIEIDGGGDPQGSKLDKRAEAEAQREREKAEQTVAQLVEKFLKDYVNLIGSDGEPVYCRPRTAEGYESALRCHVLSKPIADWRAAAVTDIDITALHEEITRSGRKTQANRVVSIMSKMFACAEKWGIRPKGSNPCKGIDRNKERQRRRYASDAELGRIRAALDAHPNQDSADVLRLLIFTGARRGEVLGMKWRNVDFGAKPTWHRKAPVMKADEDHDVVLAGPAADLLLCRGNNQVADGIFKDDGFVFASAISRTGHITFIRKTWRHVLKDAEIKEHIRIHDLRHTFASTLLGLGYSLSMIGEMLAHQSPVTTKRYAHLAEGLKREAAADMAGAFAAAGSKPVAPPPEPPPSKVATFPVRRAPFKRGA